MIEKHLQTLRTSKTLAEQTQTLAALQKLTSRSKQNTATLLRVILRDSSLLSLLLINCTHISIQMDILAFIYKLLPPTIVNAHCLFGVSTEYYLEINNNNYYCCSKLFLAHFNENNNGILCCFIRDICIKEVDNNIVNNKCGCTGGDNNKCGCKGGDNNKYGCKSGNNKYGCNNGNNNKYGCKSGNNSNIVHNKCGCKGGDNNIVNRNDLSKSNNSNISTMFMDEEGIKIFVEKKVYKIKYNSIENYEIENDVISICVFNGNIITVFVEKVDCLDKINTYLKCVLKKNINEIKTPKSNKKNIINKKIGVVEPIKKDYSTLNTENNIDNLNKYGITGKENLNKLEENYKKNLSIDNNKSLNDQNIDIRKCKTNDNNNIGMDSIGEYLNNSSKDDSPINNYGEKVYSPFKDLCLDYEKLKSVNLGPIKITVNGGDKELTKVDEISLKPEHVNNSFSFSNENHIESLNSIKSNDLLTTEEGEIGDLSYSQDVIGDYNNKRMSLINRRNNTKSYDDNNISNNSMIIDSNRLSFNRKNNSTSEINNYSNNSSSVDKYNGASGKQCNEYNNYVSNIDDLLNSTLKRENKTNSITNDSLLDKTNNQTTEMELLCGDKKEASLNKNSTSDLKKKKKRKPICMNKKESRTNKVNLCVEELIRLKRELLSKISDKIIKREERRIKILLKQVRKLK